MNEITEHKFAENMRIQLLLQQQRFGQLKFLSSRTMKGASHSIDEIIKIVTSILRNNLKPHMYQIKIFIEDSNLEDETRNAIPLYAKCYNYLLLNTNFSSQYLLKNDMILGYIVGCWPTLSRYLFLQIMWYSKCEELLIESIVHLPLDLCVEILEITIKHIDELNLPRASYCIFLLIYKIYYKCLWLHLGILSEQNVIKRISQLVTYFEMLCDLLVSPKFVTSHNLSIENKYLRHGVLVKNIIRYIRKCIYSKIENYSENHNLAKLFTLTYGNSNEHTNYLHMLPANEVKSIVIKLEQKLATLLLNQIKHIDYSEFVFWGNINDDESTMVSLQHTIIMECCYFIKFMRQNEFLVTNKPMSQCLEQLKCRLIDPKKFNKFTLTLPELCQIIAKGELHRLKELIKRYKEWDLSILNFINKRVDLLCVSDLYVIFKYLHHIFTHVHTKAERYQVYISILKILVRLKVHNIHFMILKFVEEHFDEKYLECLYNEKSFDAFIRQNSFIEDFNNLMSTTNTKKLSCRVLLIFIMLNPKEVLSKLILYEINIEFSESILFQQNMFAFFVQNYYTLKKGRHNMLMYILKNIILHRRMTLHTRFKKFMNNVLTHQMITADDVMNQLYIPYLLNSYFDKISLYSILSHMGSLLRKRLCTRKTNFTLLIAALIKTASLLRRCNITFSKFALYRRVQLIDNVMWYLRISNILTKDQNDMLHLQLAGCHMEPLDMKIMWPIMSTLQIIQEYERRCFAIHQQLRADPRCHPKLHTYVQSFSLDREAFIRHIMLNCFESEYMLYACDLTFVFWYHFGWVDEMMAYENVMRITAEASQIALMYVETFPKDTFIMCLFAIVQFCEYVVKESTRDKIEAIRRIMLKTLSSMYHMASRTHYADMYNALLEQIQGVDPHLQSRKYFQTIRNWIDVCASESESLMTPVLRKKCACYESLYCKFYSFLIDKKIAAMYDTYLFIRECIKLSNTETYQYSERLLRNLCLAE